MGTSTMGSDLHSDKQDKLLKLQARKKELEQMLAAKNEELYKLCVQEVQFTGIMPPEAPLSPEVPHRDRLGSVKSVERSTDGNDVQDGADNTSRRLRMAQLHENDRKNLTHRLSTPSISGISTKSAHSRHLRRPETSCSNFFPSPPHDRNTDTFSVQRMPMRGWSGAREPSAENVHEQPQLDVPMYRHHTMTTEYMNNIYYSNAPEAHVTRLRETHFSSSHPDITTHHMHENIAPAQPRNTPLLYQYASQLKAQSQHLQHNMMQAPPKRRQDGPRRSTLQRTQTYHLTAHSDYNHTIENDAYRAQLAAHQLRSQQDIQEQPDRNIPIKRYIAPPKTLPLQEANIRNPHNMLHVSTSGFSLDERQAYPDTMSPVSQMSGYSQSNLDSASMKFSPLSQNDMKVKEKQWYETSLDSPTREVPTLKKSSSLKRTSSVGNSQTYEIMMASGRHSAMQSPNQVPHSPVTPVMSPSGVSLDSPKNLTVVEQGKCIPYREETKPFEMSDFYKYSTKFRQTSTQKSPAPNPQNVNAMSNKLPMQLPQYAQDHWHGQRN